MANQGYVKVAAISPRVTVANPGVNYTEGINMIKKAKDEGCQIVCLPELFLSSYTCGNLFLNSTLINECEKALSDLIRQTADSDTVIIVGLPVSLRYSLYNCAVVIQSGRILGVVPKMYLSENNGCDENRYFKSGLDCPEKEITLCGKTVPFGKLLFDIGKDCSFGIEIGDDVNSPLSPSGSMAVAGASIIFNPRASVELLTGSRKREALISQQSAKCLCAYITASSGTGESTTDYVFAGKNIICENGKTISKSETFSLYGSYTAACIDIQKLNALRRKSSFNQCKVTKEYEHIKITLPTLSKNFINLKYSAHPFIPDDVNERNSRCETALNIQCAALAKRMLHTHINKLVIGISGGLDSTLALLVAHKTVKMLNLPEDNIICVTMPGFGTTDRTYQNAVELIKATGATFKEIDIKAACIQHMKDIAHDINIHDVTYENTQARERTQILMDIANKEGALLVGTGDLSEMALGWCTYNGDHMSMYCVNGGVPKTLVRHIVKYIASVSESDIADVLLRVLDTPVSPELLPPDEQGQIAQKTEDNLGPYEVHDLFLYHFVRFGFEPDKLLFIAQNAFGNIYSTEQLTAWLKTFLRRFFINQFKRSCVPDGPKVGSIGLSPRGDWSMPSDADFAPWLEELV